MLERFSQVALVCIRAFQHKSLPPISSPNLCAALDFAGTPDQPRQFQDATKGTVRGSIHSRARERPPRTGPAQIRPVIDRIANTDKEFISFRWRRTNQSRNAGHNPNRMALNEILSGLKRSALDQCGKRKIK